MPRAKEDAENERETKDVIDNVLPDEQRMYLRDRSDGYLFAYSDEFSHLPHLELVSEAEAYPERYMPNHVKKAAAKDDGKVDLAKGITPETGTEKEGPTDPALAKQAAKGWPQ